MDHLTIKTRKSERINAATAKRGHVDVPLGAYDTRSWETNTRGTTETEQRNYGFQTHTHTHRKKQRAALTIACDATGAFTKSTGASHR